MKRLTLHKFLYILYFNYIYYKTDLKAHILYYIDF
jgi:hypothetical protein